MVTVDLFKNPKTDNLGRMGNFASLAEQTQYFNGLSGLHIQGTLSEGVGEITVDEPFTTTAAYSYGRYQINGIYVYFSIRDIEVVNPTKSRIIYDVDCWETCRFQMDISLGRGHIYRSGRNLGTKSRRPFSARYGRTSIVQEIAGASAGCGFAYIHDNDTNTNVVYAMPYVGNENFVTEFIGGDWITHLGLQDINEVIGSWFSPFCPASWSGWQEVTPLERKVYHCNVSDLHSASTTRTITLIQGPEGDENTVYGITDLRGQVVWTCDSSDDFGTGITFRLNIGPSSCSWSGFINSSEYPNSKVLEGQMTIPCEPCDVWNDAFSAYQSQQRAYDMEMRALNTDKQLVNSLTSIGSQAVGGAIAGASAGPVGAIGGAALGAISGIVGAAANYITAPAFNAREQTITDDYYRRQTDGLAQSGNPLLSIIEGVTSVWLVKTTIDSQTASIYQDAINAGGYYYDVETDDMEPWIVDGPLAADVEVLGGIPSMWKEQIRARFANGVIFS